MYNSISIIVLFKTKPSVIGLYVVPTCNNSIDDLFHANLSGIPCKIVSEVYTKKVFGVKEKVVDVVSLLTGLHYTVYADKWIDVYDSKDEAIENSKLNKFDCHQSELCLLGMKYYPRDNSYIQDRNGKWASLIGKKTIVRSLPYVDETDFGKHWFIDVSYNGNIYRTLFGEWCFYEDDREPFYDYLENVQVHW